MIDLDGTLLDTAEDLALAANLMLRELGKPERSVETIKSYIGKGIQKLVKRALTGDLNGEPEPDLLEKALHVYKKITPRTFMSALDLFRALKRGLNV